MYKSGSQSESEKKKMKEKTLHERVKMFFGISNSRQGSQQNPQWKPKVEEVSLSSEIIAELSPVNPVSVRLKAMTQLYQTILTKTLEDNALLELVDNTTDLVASSHLDSRHTVFTFYKNIIEGQFEKLTGVRAFFFSMIKNHGYSEDLVPRMELLNALTQNGKNIVYFEDEMGPFLLEWTPTVFATNKTQSLLFLFINFIKYNAAYLDAHIVSGIVEHTCNLSCRSKSKEEIKLCLDILDALICYSSLPSDVLPFFVTSLCMIVNIEKLSYNCWKVMRNFLGTSMGLSGIIIMCTITQDGSCQSDYSALRGAIYFMGAALWGTKSQKVNSLKLKPTAILPSLLQAVSCPNGFVVYQVAQCIQQIISSDTQDLYYNVWEQILNIMNRLLGHPEVVSQSNSLLSACVHNVLSKIEGMARDKSFQGSEEHLYEIIDHFSHQRPETSVLRLIEYHAQLIDPIESDWIEHLNKMMEHYYKNDTRLSIRVKVLEILFGIMTDYRHMYEEKLIDQTILQFISNIDLEPDVNVRKKAVQLLVEVALNCHTIRCFDILDVIKKVMLHQLEKTKDQSGVVNVLSEDEVADVNIAVSGLVQVFKHKLLYGYPKHVIHVYQILVGYLEDYYHSGVDNEQSSVGRKIIFEFLLSLRACSSGLLGYVDANGDLQTSCNLMCAAKDSSSRPCTITGSPPVMSPTGAGGSSASICDLCVNPVFKLFIKCLKEERDWLTVKLVLQELPNILRNKALLICAKESISPLCTTLTSLVMNNKSGVPENLYNTPSRFNRTDYYSYIFPVLSTLTAYHNDMMSYVHDGIQSSEMVDMPNLMRVLIKCLEQGLKSKCQRACITGLILCTLEMQDVMYKLLPEVLLSLSKISATVPLAVPMLEFLSTLIRLPHLYMSFVEDQYMSIFAIALPYTNSFKFNHYTVALAHHVIAMWFLKCRLPFRKAFVSYIMNGLKSNVVTPFEEKKSYSQVQSNVTGVKAEAIQRPRSGSLNDPTQRSESWHMQHAAAFGPRVSLTPAPSSSDLLRPNIDVGMMNLHQELLETCHDLLSRYCFCTASTLPKRFHLTEFLTDHGNSTTWLLGHSLVTITTSGPGNKAYRDALCEQCYRLCVPQDSEESPPELPFTSSPYSTKQGDIQKERKRHRSAIQPSTREHSRVDPISVDDMLMFQRKPQRFVLKSEVPGGTTDFSTVQAASTSSSSNGQPQQASVAPEVLKSSTSGASTCSCWCPGWAEVLIRRPTGNTSWLMRIQNSLFFSNSTPDFPVPDFANWFKPSQCSESMKEGSLDSATENIVEQNSPDEEVVNASTISDTSQVEVSQSTCLDHSPLRRTSSSPDVKGDWIPQASQLQQQSPLPSSVSPVPLSPTPSKSEQFVSKSSPSSPTSKLSSDSLESSAPVIDRATQKEIRSSMRGSPKKEDKQCKPIPEELETSVKGPNRPSLTLDLSGVDNQPNKGPQHSTSPPQSAGPILAGGKMRAVPKSPFFKRVGSVSPPPSSPKGSMAPASVRDRGHTISGVSPSTHNRRSPTRSASFAARSMGTPQRDIYRVGLSPSFVFLQLYHTHLSALSTEQPLLLPRNEAMERAVKVLDHIPPYETHKIGVIYIGPDQANNEAKILSNRFGSLRYKEFLHGLGTFIRLKDVDPKFTFLGGLEVKGQDGEFACSWQDDIMQVIFHVATLMPNYENDPLGNKKKKHIGNDSVLIAYNNSGHTYDMTTVKGQFIYVCIEIMPGDHGSNVVTVKAKKDLVEILSPSDPQLVSDESLPIYVRQLALHANLASVIFQKQLSNSSDPKVTNWLERLRQIKRIKAKATPRNRDEDSNPNDSPKQFEDFTAYV